MNATGWSRTEANLVSMSFACLEVQCDQRFWGGVYQRDGLGMNESRVKKRSNRAYSRHDGRLHYEAKVQKAPPTDADRVRSSIAASWNVEAPGTMETAPFWIAGNVVWKFLVGCGLPLIVMVGMLGSVRATVVEGFNDEDGRMLNRAEVACITPWVELMKMRK